MCFTIKNKLFYLKIFLLFSQVIIGQKTSCLLYRNLLGFGYGAGYTSCITTPLNSDKNEYLCTSNDFIYTFNINSRPFSKKSGFKVGVYFDGTLGLSFSKWYYRNLTPTSEIVWQNNYGVLINFNLGFQGGYYFHEQNFVIGLRYFNNYNHDQIRSSYGNADDPSSLGVFFTKNNFNGDVSYGNDKIPGVLTRSPVTSILRFNFSYNIVFKNHKEGNPIMYVGLRFENNFFNKNYIIKNQGDHLKINGFSSWLHAGIRL